MPSDTSTTKGVYEAVRQRLLTFAPIGGGETADTILRRYVENGVTKMAPAGQARLYVFGPDDGAKYPFAYIRFLPRTTSMEHKGEREEFDVEVTCVHRPRSKFWELQALADLFDQAMLRWADPSDPAGGFLGARGRIRDTIPQPPAGSPADREVVQERIRYQIISWPHFLNRYQAA
jgi:hypothetical protein